MAERVISIPEVEEISKPWKGYEFFVSRSPDGLRKVSVTISLQRLLEMGFDLQKIRNGMLVTVKTEGEGENEEVISILGPAKRS